MDPSGRAKSLRGELQDLRASANDGSSQKSARRYGKRWELWELVTIVAGLVAGGGLKLGRLPQAAEWTWSAVTLVAFLPAAVVTVRNLLRKQLGVDLIAVLAMASALALGQSLTGGILALMLSGGTALERFSVARARKNLSALVQRSPRVAHRRDGETLVTIPVADVRVGDLLMVAPGEVLPTDGILASPSAVIDESSLTGEAPPVSAKLGSVMRSGSSNAGGPLELQVTATADKSTYEGVLRLVRQAETDKAPFVRLADRYALAFLGLTLGIAAGTWLFSGEAMRAFAVLVVATPCPLILAAPAAIISGVALAARHGIIIKGGGPLEAMARVRVLLLDKTGTLTTARPQVTDIQSFGPVPEAELLRLAGSLEQLSIHPYAPAIAGEARARGLTLSFPTEVKEEMGTGIRGLVDRREVAVGRASWVAAGTPLPSGVRAMEQRTEVEGSAGAFVAIDGSLAGGVILQDPIRPEAQRTVRELRALGIRRIHMVTGDHPDVAQLVGDALGLDHVLAERTPLEKVEAVQEVRAEGSTMMVGDGVNDAPALGLADVGVAMGATGATMAAEAADVVLTRDRLDGLVLAIRIARRTRRIALQSVWIGMSLSVVAMILAALGLIAPIAGAVLQEGLDVMVILNALRALSGRALRPGGRSAPALAGKLAEEHGRLQPQVRELATLAAQLNTLAPPVAKTRLLAVVKMIDEKLLPHETSEQAVAYPLLRRRLGREDPTGPLVETHHEIQRLARLLARLVNRVPPDGPTTGDLPDLQRVLYGLSAILTLHFGQEDELYGLLGE